MSNVNLGLKYTCSACAVRFFDLNREPAVCPRCGTEQAKPKVRVFAPPRGGTKRWPGQGAAQQAILPAEAEAAEEAPELLDDADVDVIEADDDDDDADATVVPAQDDEL